MSIARWLWLCEVCQFLTLRRAKLALYRKALQLRYCSSLCDNPFVRYDLVLWRNAGPLSSLPNLLDGHLSLQQDDHPQVQLDLLWYHRIIHPWSLQTSCHSCDSSLHYFSHPFQEFWYVQKWSWIWVEWLKRIESVHNLLQIFHCISKGREKQARYANRRALLRLLHLCSDLLPRELIFD